MIANLFEAVNRADVGVVQHRDRLCFSDELSLRPRVRDEFAGEEFQGDLSIQTEVFRQIDGSHSALAQTTDDAVEPDLLADH